MLVESIGVILGTIVFIVIVGIIIARGHIRGKLPLVPIIISILFLGYISFKVFRG